MRTQQTTALRTVLAAAAPVGLVLSAAVVWQSTAAAFTASAENADNTWRAGSVVLTDSDGGSTLFDTADEGTLKPYSTNTRCIQVDYAGTLPADIRFYVTTPAAGATTLDPFLVMSIEQGENGSAAAPVGPTCAGFRPTATPTFLYNTTVASDGTADQTQTMSVLKNSHKDYTTGFQLGSAVTEGTSFTFRITYSVKNDNDAQNTQSKATFTWEARNS